SSLALPRGILRTGGVALPLRGTGFNERLGKIFRAAAGRLKAHGVFLFTYAHSSDDGWTAVESALRHAGLRIAAAFPAETEGKNGFNRYRGSLKWNAVIVCQRDVARTATIEVRRAIKMVGVSRADRDNFRRALRAVRRVNA